MDLHIQKALHDKLYEKRKNGALELEKLVRDTLDAGDHARIQKIVDQLCHDYTYALHQPYARNGGLIGLAAASIALGPDVAPYLEEIIPPVLACFGDQDARVRYYACESMYNIAKTSKGEILPYFNEVFDALSKLSADSELSVKNGAELLDRLVKDIVSESAATYVSSVHPEGREARGSDDGEDKPPSSATAFSLPRFIPLLQERIQVLNPFSRMFLVQWIILLDSIPDLELVTHLPSFLAGLLRFLDDSNQDVVTSTQHVLERFLEDIRLIASVKHEDPTSKRPSFESGSADSQTRVGAEQSTGATLKPLPHAAQEAHEDGGREASDSGSAAEEDQRSDGAEDDWVPGQDIFLDFPRILKILVQHLRDQSENIQLTALRWLDGFFEICPEDILPVVPSLLDQVLPSLSSDIEQVRKAAARVNNSLLDYIVSIEDDDSKRHGTEAQGHYLEVAPNQQPHSGARTPASEKSSRMMQKLDYEATVNALTTQFLNENEATRAASLSWLIMLQQRAPKRVLDAHDSHFPALLKTLADTSDTVVTRDLQLLCQISRNSDDAYFSFFIVNLLKLFDGDRRLLETRGNLIIRQLCLNLSPERIYRIMADCLENEDDPEFASVMVQNLNNNLLTAPELWDLRKKLRAPDTRVKNTPQTDTGQDGQTLFVVLFKAWCNNAIASVSLCLLAQAYEQAYHLLQTFADIELTVNMLIQIDKLVQLLESPVFTYLRLQLLEPERYPFLYKTLYGILMLLPQSAAFAALKNRLNSVSAIGYLHVPSSRGGPPAMSSGAPASSSSTPGQSTVLASSRLKSRDDPTAGVRWSELLDKFRAAQERRPRNPSRTMPGLGGASATGDMSGKPQPLTEKRASLSSAAAAGDTARAVGGAASQQSQRDKDGGAPVKEHRSRFSAANLGKFTSGVRRKDSGKK